MRYNISLTAQLNTAGTNGSLACGPRITDSDSREGSILERTRNVRSFRNFDERTVSHHLCTVYSGGPVEQIFRRRLREQDVQPSLPAGDTDNVIKAVWRRMCVWQRLPILIPTNRRQQWASPVTAS